MPKYKSNTKACRVCFHPDRRSIEIAIVVRKQSVRSISQTTGISVAILDAHLKHMEKIETIDPELVTKEDRFLIEQRNDFVNDLNFLQCAELHKKATQDLQKRVIENPDNQAVLIAAWRVILEYALRIATAIEGKGYSLANAKPIQLHPEFAKHLMILESTLIEIPGAFEKFREKLKGKPDDEF